MNNSSLIHGSKKGSKQPHRPHIAPDTLVSQDTFKALYGLCEGEIYGLADGGKSIKLDGTPLINDNGQPNFIGVNWEFRPGTLDQSPISGFHSVENEQAIGVELRSDKAWTKAINNRELSAVRVRLNFNSLREQKDTGDVVGLTIEYAFDVQTNGGAFVEVGKFKVSGKSSSGFKRSHRIELPQSQNKSHRWTLRVRRITPNRNSDLVSDTVHIDALTEIIDAKLAYPCTAVLGLSYNAKTFGNVAKIAMRLKGKIIQVPNNYNPETRQYNGLWDGTFKMAYSNNPAWVYYDLCTHKRYGLGERLAGLVDKWRLYQIGQYCDEMVDDGKGGKEPRFAINVYIQKAEDAYRVLQNIASVFRGMSFWDGQQIVLDSDAPKDSVYTFSRANVVGEFVYQGTRERDRHTLISVAWSNPDNEYKTEYEPVPDEQAIARYGIKKLDIAAWGCTSQGQAQRAGLWALKSEQLETQTVSFKTGLMGFIPQVGQVINIADDIFAGRAISGRIVSANTKAKQLTLDRQAGKVGDTITLNTLGQVQTAKIVAVNNTVLTLDKAIGQTDDVWAIISDDLKLMQFRILSITQNDDATFDITALQYARQKYEVVDTGANIIQEPLTVLKATPIQSPHAVTLTANTRTHQGQAVTTLTINWEQVTGATAYIVEWRKDDGNWQTLPKVSGQSVDIDGVYSGQYIARVRAVDSFDNESLATSSQLTRITGKIGRPPRLARLTIQGKLFGMDLAWTFNKGSDDTNFTEIQVSPDGRANIATLGTFAYPTNKHEITGLQGNLTQFYRGRIVDKLGNTSDWTAWVSGTTDAQADKVLDILSGQIRESHLDQSLRTPIGKIGTLESGLNGLKGQIPTLQSAIGAINGQLPTLNNKIATAERNLQTAQSTLQTAVANITTERNRITSAIRDITALQSANTAKTQEIANLVQTVGNHTSSIRELGVTTGDLSQKYSQLKTASDTANSEITAIKQTQNGQATSIERLGAKFDSLAVGGRNLLLNTKKLTPHWLGLPTIANGVATLIATGRLHGMHQPSDTIQALDDGKVTISFFAKSNQNGRLHIRLRRQNATNQISDIAQYVMIDSREFKRYSLTLDYVKWDNQQRVNFEIVTYEAVGFVCDVKLPKLEIGTIATDWTEAPEDIQADIDTAKTETLANINTVRETLTNADIALGHRIDDVSAEFKQADNTIKASVQEEITARTNADTAIAQNVNALQSDYNNNKSSVASQIKTLSDKDKSTASQISHITANVTTAQQTANTANSKADDGIRRANTAQNTANTANSKADTANTNAQNAKRVADDALGKANTAKADIIAEQKARADSDSSLAQQISALDSKFTTADNAIKASVAQAQQTATNAQQAVATTQSQMNARFDNLAVGGRNYLLNSNTSRNSHGTTYLQVSPSLDVSKLRHFVLSCDVSYTNAHRATTQGAKWFRIGLELTCTYTDGSKKWFGVWKHSINNGDSFDGRISALCTVPSDKTLARIDSAIIQIWDIIADTMIVKNPKLELGTLATDYTLAPEDTQSQLDEKASTASFDEFKQTQATKEQATAQRINTLDTAYKLADTTLTARLAREETTRASADVALTQRVDSLQSTVSGNKSSVDSQIKALSDKEKAHATKLSQLESTLGQKASATTVNQTTTKVSQIEGRINAEAQKIATLQTTVNGQTASIRNVEQSVNGVKAIKAVTVDNNGFISGYGLMSELANGRVISRFGINADQIYFGSTTSSKKPFVFATRPITIDGISYPVGAWFNSASIAHASITNAHIANGSIDNAKIKNGAITTAKIGHAQIDTLQIKDGAVIVPRVQSFDATRLYQLNQEHEVFKLTLAETQVTTLITIHLYIDVWFDNEHVHGASDFGFYRPHIQISLLKNTTPLATRTFETLVPKPFYSTSNTGRWHNQGVAYALQGDFYLTGVMDYVANEPAVYKVLISSTIKDGDPTNYSTAHLRLSQGSICIMSAKR